MGTGNMVSHRANETNQQGMTLIELMVGVVVAALVVAAGLAMLTMSDKAIRTSEQTVDTQQNVRNLGGLSNYYEA